MTGRLSRLFGGLPRAFWVLFAGLVINRIGTFVQPFLALYLVGERHLSEEHAGQIVSTVGLGVLASGPLGGGLADRIGRRPALALATGLDAVAMLSLGVARSPWTIAAAAFAVGLFGEMYRPVTMAAALVFGGLVVSLVPETRPEPARGAGVAAPGWTAPYRDRGFLAFLLVALMVGTMFHQMGTTLPLDMGAHGLGPRTFGALLALNGMLVVLLQPSVSARAARARRSRAMALGALLTGAGFGLGAFAGAAPLAVYAASIVVWSMGEIVMSGLSPAVVADLAPVHARGGYQGAFQLAYGIGTFLAPAVGAMALQRLGPGVLWGGVFAVGLLAAAGYLVVVPDRAPARLRGG